MATIHQQCTLLCDAEVTGIGYIWGNDVRLRFRPAEPNSGIVFVRTDLPGSPSIAASIDNVAHRQRRTSLETPDARVEMVEHVMAAIVGLGIDNCTVEINAPETPGCDGSSKAFVDALQRAGIHRQSAPSPCYVVDRPYIVQDSQAFLAIFPPVHEQLVISYHLDYGVHTPIGRQSYFTPVDTESFVSELAPARTFLLEAEADLLRAQGMGARTSTSDLLVFGPDGPIGNEQRFDNEPVRHKILDIVGDLALLGRRIFGFVVAHKSGHALNAELARLIAEVVDAEVQGTIRMDGHSPMDTQAA